MGRLFSDDWGHPVGPIVIEGPSGIGKTALIGAACQIASDSGWAVLKARGDAFKAQDSYGILRQLTSSDADEPSGGLSPDDQPGAIVAMLDRLTRKLTAEHGLLIVVDDAQWSDEESSDWLSNLGPWPLHRRCRLIISLASRTPGLQLRPIERIVSQPSARVLSLRPLSSTAIGSLADGFFNATADENFILACQEATTGNPFLLVALFGELSLKGLLPDASAADRIGTTTSPAVARSVRRRLAGLAPEATALLEVTAVAATPIDLDLIAEVTKLDVARVSAWADSLAGVDLLTQSRPLSVVPPLVRRTVYAEIPPTRRAQLHSRIARSLKARGAPLDQLAEQLATGEPRGDEWVVSTLEEAASLAVTRGSPSNAVRYLSRALSEYPAARERSDLLLELARAESVLDPGSALEHLHQALDQGADPSAAAHAARQVAGSIDDLGARGKLGSMLEKISTLLSEEDVADRVDVAVSAALVSRSPRAAVIARESLSSLLDLRRHSPSHVEREALALSAVVDSGSPRRATAAEVADRVRHAALGADLVSDDPLTCELWARAVLALARAGEFEEADQRARLAQAFARSHDLPFADAEFSVTLATSLALQGALLEAEAEARCALSVDSQRPWNRRNEALACLASLLLDQGRSEEADELLSEHGGGHRPPSGVEGPTPLEQRGRLRALQGRTAEAIADLLNAGRQADEREVDSPLMTVWRSEAALCFAAEGRAGEAVRLAEENLALARSYGVPWAVGSALHVLAKVGEPDECLARLEQAVQLLDGSPAKVQLASALIDLGHALRQAGASPSEARNALRSGADIAFRSGANPLLSKATSELRLSGARPRRLALSGTQALTSSQSRIVSLAVAGLTNPEIADALFLSKKTVEGHLHHAYRKLGVRSRSDLKGGAIPAQRND